MIPKKLLALLFLLTIVLLIADASINGQSTIPSTAHPLETISTIMLFLSWLGALVNAIKVRSWKWFLALLLLSLFALPVYLLVGPGPTRTENSPTYWESHMIPRKIIAILYVLGLGLMIADATFDQQPSYSITTHPAVCIGAILYLLAWILALVNVVKARYYPYLTLLIFPLSLFILPVYFILGTGPTQEVNDSVPKE